MFFFNLFLGDFIYACKFTICSCGLTSYTEQGNIPMILFDDKFIIFLKSCIYLFIFSLNSIFFFF